MQASPQQFVLRPNHSLSQRGLSLSLIAFGVVMLILGTRFAMLGLWPILPFLFIDLAALIWAMVFIRRRCALTETVTVDKASLQIHHQEPSRRQSWRFNLSWVQVKLLVSTHPWGNSRLLVGSHGKWVELGSFLTNEERAGFKSTLSQCILSKKSAV